MYDYKQKLSLIYAIVYMRPEIKYNYISMRSHFETLITWSGASYVEIEIVNSEHVFIIFFCMNWYLNYFMLRVTLHNTPLIT